jgi:ATP-dependent Clp protease ATP-binding subunit ClpC
VVELAQEGARLLDHDHIGTEHILPGLIHEGDGVAARAPSWRYAGVECPPSRSD